ncbi:MAG: hypothetical protein M1832_003622 [Thelocarpon impressellum]|nr:MAG: hypothetical protein M1832_003622 [Thelocarpon impressellum]
MSTAAVSTGYNTAAHQARMQQPGAQAAYSSQVQDGMAEAPASANGYEQARSHSSNSNISHPGHDYSQQQSTQAASNLSLSNSNTLPQPRQYHYGTAMGGVLSTANGSYQQHDYSSNRENARSPATVATQQFARPASASSQHGQKQAVSQSLQTHSPVVDSSWDRQSQATQPAANYSYTNGTKPQKTSQENHVSRTVQDGQVPQKSDVSTRERDTPMQQPRPIVREEAPQAQARVEHAAIDKRTSAPTYYAQGYGHVHTDSASIRAGSSDRRESARAAPDPALTTVNPSHIYNPYHEYQRELAASEAVAAHTTPQTSNSAGASVGRGAAIVHAASPPVSGLTDANSANVVAPVHDATADRTVEAVREAALGGLTQGTRTKTPGQDMEAQMRLMVEKMREYQSKDPSLFSHVFEQVKKAGQGTQEPRGQQASTIYGTEISIGDVNGQLSSPSPTLTQNSSTEPQDRLAGAKKTMIRAKGLRKAAEMAPAPVDTVIPVEQHVTQTAILVGPSVSKQKPIEKDAEMMAATESSATTTTARPPPSAKSGKSGTVWPENDKASLATAAATALMTAPGNAGKVITPQQIFALLDRCPSYIELCESIERLGFVIDRRNFARFLLSAVPQNSSSNTLADKREAQAAAATNGQATSNQDLQHHAEMSHGAHYPQTASQSMTQTTNTHGPATVSTATQHPPKRGPGRPRKDGTPAQPKKHRDMKHKPANDQISQAMSSAVQAIEYASGAMTQQSFPPGVDGPAEQQSHQYRNANGDGAGPRPRGQAARANPNIQAQQQSMQSAISASGAGDETSQYGLESQKAAGTTGRGKAKRGATGGSLQNAPDAARAISGSDPQNAPSRILGNGQNNRARPGGATVTPTPAPRPMTKAESARKRSFSEIVDLTQEHPDFAEAPMRPWKHPRTGNQPINTNPAGPMQSSANEMPFSHGSGLANSGIVTPVSGAENTGQLDTKWRNTPLVQPFDRKKAIRRSGYSPRTIARDVLIATGRHPTQRGLNEHLAALKRNFNSVTNAADLSTFAWDVVDPGGPPVGSANPKPTPTRVDHSSHGQAEIVTLDGPASPIQASKRGRPRLSAVTGGPVIEDDNSAYDHLAVKDQALMPSRHGKGVPASDAGVRSRPMGFEGAGKADGKSSPAARRGRPPGSSKAASGTRQSILTDRSREQDDSTPSWPSSLQFAVVIESRPPSMAAQTMAASVLDEPTTVAKKPKRKSTAKTTRGPAKNDPPVGPGPAFSMFSCRWKDCKSTLHNLATLRQHLKTVHCRLHPAGGWPCEWNGCIRVTNRHNGKYAMALLDFDTEAIWDEHMEKHHIEPFAWAYGDGPTLKPAGDKDAGSAGWLGDGRGAEMTPQAQASAAPIRHSGRAPEEDDDEEGAEDYHSPRTVERARELMEQLIERRGRSGHRGEGVGALLERGGAMAKKRGGRKRYRKWLNGETGVLRELSCEPSDRRFVVR